MRVVSGREKSAQIMLPMHPAAVSATASDVPGVKSGASMVGVRWILRWTLAMSPFSSISTETLVGFSPSSARASIPKATTIL